MTLNQLFWKLTKEKFYPSWGCFSNLYFVQRDFFNICVLSQCILYWINLQNRYTFTYQKTLLHTLLLLVSKIVVSLHCILILNSNGEAKIECFSCTCDWGICKIPEFDVESPAGPTMVEAERKIMGFTHKDRWKVHFPKPGKYFIINLPHLHLSGLPISTT